MAKLCLCTLSHTWYQTMNSIVIHYKLCDYTNSFKLLKLHAAISDSPLLVYKLLADTTGKPNCIHMHEQHMKHKYKGKVVIVSCI